MQGNNSQCFTLEEIRNHNVPGDCWIVVDNKVYDVSKFMGEHPGGKKVLLDVAGKDASKQFHYFHSADQVLNQYAKLQIGIVGDKPSEVQSSGDIFGSDIPYSEPAWYRGYQSPYYKETHRKYRAMLRNYVENELRPHASNWEEEHDYPSELHEKAYKAGVYGSIWPKEYGGTPPEDFDIFHEVIYWDEVARCGSGGLVAALFFTIKIALPPILMLGSDDLKEKVAREVITGKKIIALAITEPGAGSDVANIETIARRDGDYYIVSGQKKFITSGMKCHYFVTAVRTGNKGMGGISLLLIESNTPGITRRRMKTQGWWASNTTHIVFDEVKVPVSNIIGKENEGFRAIMLNFNNERFAGMILMNRGSRGCIQEAIRYGRIRKTFGKRLVDNQVIRHKLAEMIIRVEAVHSMLEHLAFQMHCGVSPLLLAGPISLLKVQTTKAMEFCAREASQIIGGASVIRGGHGETVERIYREVRTAAIGGGSEEVMTDLAMRLANL